MKFKRIALLSHEMTYTGAPNSLLNIASTLKKRGHSVTVYTLENGIFESEYKSKGFKVNNFTVLTATEQQRTLFSQNYDLLICNTVFCAKSAYLMQNKMPVLLYIREAENLPFIMSSCNISDEYVNNIRNVVCVSEYAYKFISANYTPSNLWIVHNFLIKPRFFRPSANVVSDGRVHFLIAATIEERKGIKIALEAFDGIDKALKSKAVLHIAGRTPDWSHDYWQDINFNSYGVVFHGEISDRSEMIKLIKRVNVSVVSSFDESCSLSALEGAMCGKALIVTENVGAKYIVDEYNGFIVKTGSVSSLRNAMEDMIRNADRLKEMGAVSAYRFKKSCGEKKYYQNLKKVFANLQ